jgi:hypothetical protein
MMRHYTNILFSIIILFAPQFSSASSIRQLDIPELLQQSEIVFEGQVIKKETRWNDLQTDIITDITFRVDDVVVGTYLKANLTLSFIGGTVGQTTISIAGSKMPSLNESGVYFVGSTTQQLVNPLTGWAQGHFITRRDGKGAIRIMTHDQTPVAGINWNQKKSKYISDGNATGITRSESNELSNAMMLDDFKTALKKQSTDASE